MRSLADNPYGQREYVYLTQEAKRKREAATSDKRPKTNAEYTRPIRTYTASSKLNPILKGIGIGLLVDIGIFFLTFVGFLLDLLFGKQDYNFVLAIPPVIGGIIGAIGSLKTE